MTAPFRDERQVPAMACPGWLERRFAAQRAFLDALSPFPFGAVEDEGCVALHRNDYLRLGGHADVVRARRGADEDVGAALDVGDGTTHPAHRSFRALLRTSLRATDVILTASGWSANVGLLEALASPDVSVYVDAEAHGSMRDGGALAHAHMIDVPHHDVAALDRLVSRHGPGVVCIDAINSTRGCSAPVEEYVAVCERHDCVLLLDESHAFGMMGEGSGGLAVASGCAERIHFRTMSFGKALGGHGGAIAVGGGGTISRDLALRLHPVLFSSSTSPALAAGHERALRLATAEPWRADRCRALAARLRARLLALGVRAHGGESQIVSVAFPDLGACRLFAELRARRILGAVFLPPVLREGSLLRFTVHAMLTERDVDTVADAVAAALASRPTRSVPA